MVAVISERVQQLSLKAKPGRMSDVVLTMDAFSVDRACEQADRLNVYAERFGGHMVRLDAHFDEAKRDVTARLRLPVAQLLTVASLPDVVAITLPKENRQAVIDAVLQKKPDDMRLIRDPHQYSILVARPLQGPSVR